MKTNKYLEKTKELLDGANIPYFEGAEILQEIGRPYLYRLELYKEKINIYIKEDTEYLYIDKEPTEKIKNIIKEATQC